MTRRIVQGGAHFSIREERNEQAAIATVRAAYDAGVRRFDTARAYATIDDPAHNERLLARALAGRDEAFIATKGGHYRVDQGTWAHDSSPARLRADAELSRRVLGVDALDLFFLHKPDGMTPVEDSVAALDELRRDGIVRRIGVSNVSLDEFERSMAVAHLDAVQTKFSPLEYSGSGVRDRARDLGVEYWGYSPLGGSRFRAEVSAGLPSAHAAAAQLSLSFAHVVLAWLLAIDEHAFVITGAGSPQSARDSAAAATTTLPSDVVAAISAEAQALALD